jgi:hypothetical protein
MNANQKQAKAINFRNFITSLNGRFFTVEYTLKSGHVRKLNGRTGVIKYLKGGVNNNKSKLALCVWECKKKDYRTVNLDNILAIRANKMSIVVQDKAE